MGPNITMAERRRGTKLLLAKYWVYQPLASQSLNLTISVFLSKNNLLSLVELTFFLSNLGATRSDASVFISSGNVSCGRKNRHCKILAGCNDPQHISNTTH